MFSVSSVLCSYLAQLEFHSRTCLFSKYNCVMLSRKHLRWCWITSTLTELTPLRRVSAEMSIMKSVTASLCNEIIVVYLLSGDGSGSNNQSISLSLSNGVIVMNYVATFLSYIQEVCCWGRCSVQALWAGCYNGIMFGVHARVCVQLYMCVVAKRFQIVPEDVNVPFRQADSSYEQE